MTTKRYPAILPEFSDTALIETALRRGASRRQLIRWLSSAGMATAMASTIVASASRALAQTPQRGGRIRVASQTSSTADTVDPAKQNNQTDYTRCFTFYNGLTRLDQSLTPQPELAESFANERATVWTFKIRQGVKFHDGSPLTAVDVVYSLARHKDPKTGSAARALALPMEEITATGTHEVRIALASPNADLPVVLGTPHFLIIKDGTTDFSKAVGTGPYRCQEFMPGVKSIAVRNPDYWKSGRPYLDEIELIGIPDETARLNALLSGDVHVAASISPRLARRVQTASGYAVFETKAGGYNDVVMRKDADPSRNPDLVLALKHLQDREQMRSAVFQGYAVVANDQPIDPTNRFFFPGLAQRPFDPEKARFHLQRSGFANTPIPIHTMASSTMLDQAVLLQQAGQGIGMNIDVKRMPADGYWSNVWMKFPLTFGSINPRPSADVLFTLFFKSDSNWNESAWRSERFDQLLVTARAETDDARRRQMYGEMQTLVHNECGIGIPVFFSILDAHTTKLKGLRAIPTGGLMGYSYSENVWLES
ncbi:MAG: ABC transporter substrate-binding protein [Proteobacteria bacterium]|nr:ABC transporter substrate-binding protein [Pseudomonadota bacterium]